MLSFDLLPVLPEINALQSAMRGKIARVHRRGREARPLRGRLHLREVRHRHDEVGQRRPDRRAPAEARPAAALLHRLLHVHEVVRAPARGVRLPGRDAPRALPGRRARSRDAMRDYVVDAAPRRRSSRRSRRSPGSATTRTGCASCLARSARGRGRPGRGAPVGASTGRRRSTPTSAASTTSARSSPRSAAREDAVDYYRALRAEVEERIARRARARSRPTGDSSASASAWSSRARPTGPASASSGRCSPTRARSSWPRPTPRSAASTTSASATIPTGPLETLADYCMGCYTNLNLPDARRHARRATCADYDADGFLINSVKSCNSFSAGQLTILREVESAHRAARRLHRERPRRPALLLRGQHQEPARVVLPDDRAEARGGRAHETTASASTSARRPPRRSSSTRTARSSGRGITNSRSNYDVACEVALGEALINARFALLDARARAARRGAGRARGAARRPRARASASEQYRVAARRARATSSTRLARAAATGARGARARRSTRSSSAMARGGGRALRRRRDAARATSSATSPAAATCALAEERRARARASRSTASWALRQGDPRGREPADGGGPLRATTPRAALAGMARRAAPRSRAAVERGRGVPLEQVGAASAPATAARASPSPKEQIRSEILCHGLGAHAMFPDTRTVLDIGGQDTKAIQVDDAGHRHVVPDERPLRRRAAAATSATSPTR